METTIKSIKSNENIFEANNGMYGDFGGMYVPPHLEEKLIKLADFFQKEILHDDFENEYKYYHKW